MKKTIKVDAKTFFISIMTHATNAVDKYGGRSQTRTANFKGGTSAKNTFFEDQQFSLRILMKFKRYEINQYGLIIIKIHRLNHD